MLPKLGASGDENILRLSQAGNSFPCEGGGGAGGAGGAVASGTGGSPPGA